MTGSLASIASTGKSTTWKKSVSVSSILLICLQSITFCSCKYTYLTKQWTSGSGFAKLLFTFYGENVNCMQATFPSGNNRRKPSFSGSPCSWLVGILLYVQGLTSFHITRPVKASTRACSHGNLSRCLKQTWVMQPLSMLIHTGGCFAQYQTLRGGHGRSKVLVTAIRLSSEEPTWKARVLKRRAEEKKQQGPLHLKGKQTVK